MILPASYSNGFAPRDGRPLYPSLWRGCVGAWNPGLGVSGLSLRDWSGFGNHGTLTNMITADDWVPNGGKYALDFDGVNDYVTASDRACAFGDANTTIAAWVWLNNTSTSGGMFGYGNGSQELGAFAFYSNARGAGVPSVEFGGGNPAYSSTPISTGTWVHVAAVKRPGVIKDTIAIYYNGIIQTINAASSSSNAPNLSSGAVNVGAYANILVHCACKIDDFRIYSRALSASEVRLLASRRGIAYELAPRRRSSSAVQFNRRRRLLLGAS